MAQHKGAVRSVCVKEWWDCSGCEGRHGPDLGPRQTLSLTDAASVQSDWTHTNTQGFPEASTLSCVVNIVTCVLFLVKGTRPHVRQKMMTETCSLGFCEHGHASGAKTEIDYWSFQPLKWKWREGIYRREESRRHRHCRSCVCVLFLYRTLSQCFRLVLKPTVSWDKFYFFSS